LAAIDPTSDGPPLPSAPLPLGEPPDEPPEPNGGCPNGEPGPSLEPKGDFPDDEPDDPPDPNGDCPKGEPEPSPEPKGDCPDDELPGFWAFPDPVLLGNAVPPWDAIITGDLVGQITWPIPNPVAAVTAATAATAAAVRVRPRRRGAVPAGPLRPTRRQRCLPATLVANLVPAFRVAPDAAHSTRCRRQAPTPLCRLVPCGPYVSPALPLPVLRSICESTPAAVNWLGHYAERPKVRVMTRAASQR
jgi:hypothetical protein